MECLLSSMALSRLMELKMPLISEVGVFTYTLWGTLVS